MRREFTDVVEVYNGSSGTNPNQFRGTITCKVVPSQRKLILTDPWNIITGYVTHVSPLIRAAQVVIDPPFFKSDLSFGSVIILPLTGFTANIVWTERILPRSGSPYLRSWFTN